jgi:hypothetical protein
MTQTKSISDDDICSVCKNCVYKPGEESSCQKGWPGEFDADGCCHSCREFADGKKKFFKTVWMVTVLSEDRPTAPDLSLADLAYEIDEGECVGQCGIIRVRELTEREVRTELVKMGSDPSFFGLEEPKEHKPIRISWEIDAEPDDIAGYLPVDNKTIEERALSHARKISGKYFDIQTWVFNVEIEGRKFKVDLEDDTVTEVK